MAAGVRDRMVQSAIILLAKRGYQATSFSEVLAGSQPPRGSIYHHFPEGKDQLDKVKKLSALAGELGMPVHHLALLWCLANPHVSTVILGASKLSQLKDNLKALDSRDKLTPEVLARIEEIAANKPAGPQRFV